MPFISVRRHGVMVLASAALTAGLLVPVLPNSLGATSANAVTASSSAGTAKTAVATKTVAKKAVAKKKTPKQIARDLAKTRYGWTSTKQWTCLKRLWHRESGWRVKAGKPHAAYGIPQAYPGKKMGKGWRTSATTQIKWGLKYIDGRYDTPCKADTAQRTKGWY